MPDHFAVLAQPRRPWLDEEVLKERFHRASAAFHPDVEGGGAEQFSAVNAAYSALRDPVSRLRHLLELEAPDQLARPQAIPSEFADFFMRLADLRGALDRFHKKEVTATSALARALLADERPGLQQRLGILQTELQEAHDRAMADLRALDAAWAAQSSEAAEQLAALHHRLAYLVKWRSQVSESLFKLQS